MAQDAHWSLTYGFRGFVTRRCVQPGTSRSCLRRAPPVRRATRHRRPPSPSPSPRPLRCSPPARSCSRRRTLDRMMEAPWREAGVVPGAGGQRRRVAAAGDAGPGRPGADARGGRALRGGHQSGQARPDGRSICSPAPDYAEWWADVALDLYVARQFRKPGMEKQLDPRGYFVAAFRDNVRYDRMVTDMLTFSGDLGAGRPGRVPGVAPARRRARSAGGRVGARVPGRAAVVRAVPRPSARRALQAGRLLRAGRVLREDALQAGREAHLHRAQAARRRRLQATGHQRRDRRAAALPGPRRCRAIGDESLRDTAARAIVDVGSVREGGGVAHLGAAVRPGHRRARGTIWAAKATATTRALLRRLADDFRAGGFDFKRLLRLLVLSRAYGLSSATGGAPAAPRARGVRARARSAA